MDLRAGLVEMGNRKSYTLPRLELRPLSRPARSQSLYRLPYPGANKVYITVKRAKLFYIN
jgi:hypothetical protein